MEKLTALKMARQGRKIHLVEYFFCLPREEHLNNYVIFLRLYQRLRSLSSHKQYILYINQSYLLYSILTQYLTLSPATLIHDTL